MPVWHRASTICKRRSIPCMQTSRWGCVPRMQNGQRIWLPKRSTPHKVWSLEFRILVTQSLRLIRSLPKNSDHLCSEMRREFPTHLLTLQVIHEILPNPICLVCLHNVRVQPNQHQNWHAMGLLGTWVIGGCWIIGCMCFDFLWTLFCHSGKMTLDILLLASYYGW